MDIDSLLSETGCTGEWYDANDTEQYLRGLGLILDDNPCTAAFVNNGKVRFFDMAKFIDSLLQRATCLLRSVGFRREDVDRTLAYFISTSAVY